MKKYEGYLTTRLDSSQTSNSVLRNKTLRLSLKWGMPSLMRRSSVAMLTRMYLAASFFVRYSASIGRDHNTKKVLGKVKKYNDVIIYKMIYNKVKRHEKKCQRFREKDMGFSMNENFGGYER